MNSDPVERPRVDVLIFGGGIAGLWTLHLLLSHGYDAYLCESDALGAGQSVQAQGIVHGGGKYALRAVGDLEAIKAIRGMPERWRAHHSGSRTAPDLRGARLLSDHCWLWLPRGTWRSRLQAWGLAPILRHGRLLASRPEKRPASEWPGVLRESAVGALRMSEPVFDTRSVLEALRDPLHDRLLRVARVSALTPESGTPGRDARGLRLVAHDGASLDVEARAVVLAAGAGNADLLEVFGCDGEAMQRRPLQMAVLRGVLPALHGHCIDGGRTRITVTSVDEGEERVWQVGGELSERYADAEASALEAAALTELRSCLPGLDLSRGRITSYRAVRAEARDAALRRPSGAHVRTVTPGVVVAWPTKWALAPLLAEDVLEEIRRVGLGPSGPAVLHGSGRWPRPVVAPFPWENRTWTNVSSVEVA